MATNWITIDLMGGKQLICWFPNEEYRNCVTLWARERKPVLNWTFTPFEVEVNHLSGKLHA